MKKILKLFKQTARGWRDHNISMMAAALSYYTFFSLAPLLLIAVSIAGFFFDRQEVVDDVMLQISHLVGPSGALVIHDILLRSGQQQGTGIIGVTAGSAAIILGALFVFMQLQISLNIIWGAPVHAAAKGPLAFMRNWLLSFSLILAAGFLLLVSLLLSAVLSAVSHSMEHLLPGTIGVWGALNFVASLGIITLLFALLFKVLPNTYIEWRDVWIGALITAALFNIGKFFIGLYIGSSFIASTYGAAASIVVILLWVFYASQILYIGAEFTRRYCENYGSRSRRKEHAA